jgi:hypothetical protein
VKSTPPPAPVKSTPPPAPVKSTPPPAPVKSTPPPSGVWPNAHDAKPVQVAYATTGVVLFDDNPLPEPPPVLAKDKAALLKQKVAAACGSRARDVIVETKPDGGLLVHVMSTAPSDNVGLSDQILRLPEMASPNVKLDFVLPK